MSEPHDGGEGSREEPVEIDHRALDSETLRALAEDYVSRDGTDYGEVERSLEEKVARLLRQLELGKARIVYESRTESVNIISTEDSRHG